MGVEKFDEHHKRIFAFINDLNDAMERGRGTDLLGEILDKLADHCEFHFAAEENLMEKHLYPYLEAHRREHEKLTAQVEKMRAALKAGDELRIPAVLDFLTHWLSNHIHKIDKEYGPFLNDRGVH